jgi:Rap1a immunity proteins
MPAKDAAILFAHLRECFDADFEAGTLRWRVQLREHFIRMRYLVAVAPLVASQAPCIADDYYNASSVSAATLIDECRKAEDPMRINCAGYILGVFDQMVFSRLICPRYNPSGLGAQAVAVALKFLNDHPERWDVSPTVLIGQSFKAAFPPCGTGQD